MSEAGAGGRAGAARAGDRAARILHITPKDSLEHARDDGIYRAGSLATEGFIHCSTPAQLVATAGRHFLGRRDLVVLVIDADRVVAEIRFENTSGGAELFPHVYGPLNLDAVVDVVDFPCRKDGGFDVPPRLRAMLES